MLKTFHKLPRIINKIRFLSICKVLSSPKNTNNELQLFQSCEPFHCEYGARLDELQLAYETWGTPNGENTVLLFHGLSSSQHARSKLGCDTSKSGWWESFIGPGLFLDTDKFHVICCNLIGSCHGSTGPSSIDPKTKKHYGGSFPIVSISDMVHSQFILLDHLKIDKVHAVVGASLGGLASFMAAALYAPRIQRMVSISAGGTAVASAIAFRYLQRVALMADPNWNGGNYYDATFPEAGTNLARKIATLTYRSGPEWDERFNVKKINDPQASLPRYTGVEFQIEDYIRHQGESFATKTNYDPNSLIYLSKAMDIFNIGEGYASLKEGFGRITCPSLILGASSDILYPASKQEEAATLISQSGNKNVELKITKGMFGHDTFLLDTQEMGKHIKNFLEN